MEERRIVMTISGTAIGTDSAACTRPPNVAVSSPVPVRRRLLVAACWLALFAIVFVALLVASARSAASSSDAATVLLEGHSMSGGNLTLSGWSLSRDSFWTIDALIYLVATMVAGIRPALLNVVPALVATAIVGLGCWAAVQRRRGLSRAAALAVVIALLALPGHALGQFFLQSGMHDATALWCLVAFVALSSGRLGWNWVLATVALTLALLGDLQAAAFGLAPVLGAGLLAMGRRRDWLAGLGDLGAVGASVLFAFAARSLADRFGTFAANTGNPTAPVGQMFHNLGDLAHLASAMLGLRAGPYGPSDLPVPVAALHLLGIVALLLSMAGALAGAVRGVAVGLFTRRAGSSDAASSPARTDAETWRLDDLLLLAALADTLVFLRLDDPPGVSSYGRYLSAAIVFAAILAGRFAGRLAANHRLVVPPARTAVALVLGGVLTVFVAGFAISYRYAAPRQPAAVLATFLRAHHLTHGLADYWAASITTVESSGAVVLRPVIDAPDGLVERYRRQSEAAWYAGQRFQFLAYDGLGLVDEPTAVATFGRPTHDYAVGPYHVLIWSHSISVSVNGSTS